MLAKGIVQIILNVIEKQGSSNSQHRGENKAQTFVFASRKYCAINSLNDTKHNENRSQHCMKKMQKQFLFFSEYNLKTILNVSRLLMLVENRCQTITHATKKSMKNNS